MMSSEDYSSKVVDPLLSDLRKALMQERPASPASFLIELLKSRTADGAHISDLVQAMKHQPFFVSDDEEDLIASPVSGVLSPSHSPSNLQKYFEKGQRLSFSAVPTDDILKLFENKPVVGEKTVEEIERVKRLLKESALGKERDPEELDLIARGMVEVVIEEIGKEVEFDNSVLVVEEGSLEKHSLDGSKRVKTINPREVIGDPSALFSYCPDRTVLKTTSEEVVLWRISQQYLDYITRTSAIARRERYLAFLSSVPIFKSMDEEELAKISDALKHEHVPAGTTFMKQGELGNKFCIIESGICVATKSYVTGQTIPTEVFRYKAGDYVGELSLLHNEPRAANVTAVTDVSLLCIDRKSFKRLLGPVQDILLRNTTRYEGLGIDKKSH
jgi:cAMP-dependent protein kinase regulator